MAFVQHLIILVYKNILLKIRKPLNTLLELSLPLQLIIIIWLFTTLGFNTPVQTPHFLTLTPQLPSGTMNKKIALLVQPTSSQKIRDSVPFITNYIEQKTQLRVDQLNSQEEYLKNYKKYITHFIIQGGGSDGNSDVVVIQNRTDVHANQTIDYVQSGFMSLQTVLQEAFVHYKLENKVNKKYSIHLQTREFPIKGDSSILTLITGIMYPLYFSMSVINLFLPHVVSLVNEKKENIKSGLQMMGCSMVAYNISWYIIAVIETIIILFSTTIAIYALGIFKYTSATLYMVAFCLYILSFIPLANSCSLFFKEPKYASIFGQILFMISIGSWIVGRFIVFPLFKPAMWAKILFNLFSPFAFCEFMFKLSQMESDKQKFGWGQIGSLSDYSVAWSILLLFIDCILYLIISLYLEKVIASDSSTASSSPFFIFQFSFWKNLISSLFNRNSASTAAPTSNYGMLTDDEEDNIELQDSSDHVINTNNDYNPLTRRGIQIEHLTKSFTSSKMVFMREIKTVVDDLSLQINEGEIFALLGANGAGKTTTIKMLTGLLAPTSGNAFMNGKSIANDMDAIRQQLGICPQENLIFDKLTVQEHLQIFGIIKGVPYKSLTEEINQRLEQVGLLEEKKSKASDLSGGMKRRMCIAIALIGNPSVIILDEPTSGLDPLSRRNIWELLQKNKLNKTIILTTHSMEEADILGDGGIAILKKGRLEVVGTSLFLKNHYGIGYNLHLVTSSTADNNENDLTQFVVSHVPDAKLKSREGSLFIYSLPYQSVSRFPAFLKQLESDNHSFELESFLLTQTTLEEVFLKINEEENVAQ